MLCQIAIIFVLGKGYASCVGWQMPCYNFEQGGFAGAVDANDSGFLVIFYVK